MKTFSIATLVLSLCIHAWLFRTIWKDKKEADKRRARILELCSIQGETTHEHAKELLDLLAHQSSFTIPLFKVCLTLVACISFIVLSHLLVTILL